MGRLVEVQLTAKNLGSSAGAAWLPGRILSNDVGEVPGPGAFAMLGDRQTSTIGAHRGNYSKFYWIFI